MNAYEILTGAGRLYVAAVGTQFPAVNATPGASWTDLGETDGGLTAKLTQKIDEHRTDQRTGAVKATRSEESLTLETSLLQATLENLAKILGQTVTVVAPGSGTIGTKTIPLYRGPDVAEYAVLVRGKSAYGGWNAQYQIPRMYFGEDVEEKKVKDKAVQYKALLKVLEDLNAAADADRFGKLIAQSAAAL